MTPEEIRDLTVFWLGMAEGHPDTFAYLSEEERWADSEFLGMEAQWELERSFKGLLAASNDTVRFRRDAVLMWRHVESLRPTLDREGAEAMRSYWPPPRNRTGSDAVSPPSPRPTGGTNRRRS